VSAPRRPLALTIGAAAATLVVVSAILAGPTLVNCASSADGLVACFRDSLGNAGLLPKTAIAKPEPVSAEAATPHTQVTPAVAPQPAATADAATASPAPSFGLLRAEPDGSTVIAGSGAPGSEVEIFSNGAPLGKTKVEASGDWVFVPSAPLPTGGAELTVGLAGSIERSPQSFVVVIDENKKAEPLVVASVPGKASEVLQGLADAKSAEMKASTETKVAAADTPAPPAAPVAPASGTPPSDVPAAAQPPVAQPSATLSIDMALANPPSIDAIEIDGERNFFAGAGAEESTVRLYVDDKFIADAIVAGGRWLVETSNVLTKPIQRVRVDMLNPGSAEVASRAEVNFVVDLPKPSGTEPPTAVAEASPLAPTPATRSAAAAAPAPTITEGAQPNTPAGSSPPIAAPTAPSVTAPTLAAPSVQPVETLPPAAVAAPSAPAMPAPAPSAESLGITEPAAPSAPTAPVTAGLAPAAELPQQPAAEQDVPTFVAKPVGDPQDLRVASGKAIIRRGDNLWTIARRVYGEGIKYTTIYDANSAQIRDPDRIYPGQVFDLPDTSR
jgi:nucleoid-associated protein YgaU